MKAITLSNVQTSGIQFRAMLEQLEKNFPPNTFTPIDDINTIMYRSGQRSVVDWINNYLEDLDG
jgi:hypothetical protein